MIDPKFRFCPASGSLLTGGPYTWHIVDIDQRRHFAVTYDPPVPLQNDKDIDATEEICINQLQRCIDKLGSGVYGIRFTEPDGPVTIITDPEEDMTQYANNHPLKALELPFTVKTVYLTNLTELDRLANQVDLVSYPGPPHLNGRVETIAVFKYWFIHNSMHSTWRELECWSRLPRDHPHIVPFDSVVLDSITGGVVGFTNLYIPGGNLDDTATTRPFRLRWLHQLLSVVDDLNHRYGVMHQDIAPRNLVIDEREENLRIFDFGYSAMIDDDYSPHYDDWKGVVFTLYEIITRDVHLRRVPHEQQDADALLQRQRVKHPDVKLDSDVQTFRDVLDSWLVKRKATKFKPADTWIHWFDMPDAPPGWGVIHGPNGETTRIKKPRCSNLWRKNLVKWGKPFWNWERPAGHLLAGASKGVHQKAAGDKNSDEKAAAEKDVDQKATGDKDPIEAATDKIEVDNQVTAKTPPMKKYRISKPKNRGTWVKRSRTRKSWKRSHGPGRRE
ncbi:hypothetical protein E4U43_005019 [Claviceps pusilla]|uniref:EKC/KEOPS complex subunit BUD32 n=1 Tax=Claviceps pusilla TaxID=123648 RepID=A0A9P7T2T1_9HYPO|nr:hypothetical protein E4U43_005019 [Claviceps pusilla]